MMSRYQRARSLKQIGPHRGLADELLNRWRVECERCGGSGVVGWEAGRMCVQCEGSGGFWNASEEALMAAYQAIIARFPDAGAAGCLNPGSLPVE